MLELKNIFKKYANDKTNALEDISISLPSKGLVSIVGESGSGKSTLLNLIGLLDRPTSGTIYLDGKDITNLTKDEEDYYHQAVVSFIFQQYNLIKYLNVDENIKLASLDNQDYILRKLKIKHLKDKKISLLSGGEQERVAIARALAKRPKILLCDEPTAALDSKTADLTMKMLKDISKDILVVVVTHNRTHANRYSDRIISLSDGRIVSDIKRCDFKDKSLYLDYKAEDMNIKNIYNIVKNNIKSKKKRNILTSIAFSIGLISLLLVLSLSNGFNEALDREEKASLSEYPIYISESSTDLSKDLSNLLTRDEVKDDNKLYLVDNNHKNIIDMDYINYIRAISTNYKYEMYTYNINNRYISTLPINNIGDFYTNFDLLYGEYPIFNNEVLLVIDNTNKIDKNMMSLIGLTSDEYEIKNLIGHRYLFNETEYVIKGILRGKEDTLFSDITNIYYLNTYLDIVPVEIYLYPKDYESKEIIINYLNRYSKNKIYFTDYSSTVKSLSNTIVDAISIILICFSLISLTVSTIMIGIITYISVIERVHEIGILKALGISNINVKKIYMYRGKKLKLCNLIEEKNEK